TQASEPVTIESVSHSLDPDDGGTTVILTEGLQNGYLRKTVRINANVAHATHGETVTEVLGNGDPASAFQHFTLRQPPLTYVSGATDSGGESTLEVRVNDVHWHEKPFFYDHAPNERIFVARRGDDGKTTLVFGNGTTGARLPSGIENV